MAYHGAAIGRLAQLGERFPYKEEVGGSSPSTPTVTLCGGMNRPAAPKGRPFGVVAVAVAAPVCRSRFGRQQPLEPLGDRFLRLRRNAPAGSRWADPVASGGTVTENTPLESDGTAELERQIAITRAVSSLVGGIALSDDEMISDALSQFRTAVGVKRISVRRLVEDAHLGASLQIVAVADPEPDASVHELVPLSAIPNAEQRLRAGEVAQFSSPSDLPEGDREYVSDINTALQSALVVPASMDSELLGIVLFGEGEAGRGWSDDEVEILRIVADLYAFTWARESALQSARDAIELRDRDLRLREALVTCSTMLLGPSATDALPAAVVAVLGAIGGNVAYIDTVVTDHPAGEGFSTLHIFEPGAIRRRPESHEPWSKWPTAYAAFKAGQPFVYRSLDELPTHDRKFVETFVTPVQAGMDYPILVGAELIGVVGISDGQPRDWQENELNTLASVARMVGAHWERERARERLEALVDAKDEFLASVSHELRTPLAAILGLSTLLRDERAEIDDESVSEMISVVTDQSNELANLVDDVLVFTRSQDSTLTVVSEDVDLGEAIDTVVKALPLGRELPVTVSGGDGVFVTGDRLRVRQIVRNLLTNARRHGGPSVSVVVSVEDTTAKVAVCDDGPPIPEAVRDGIFESYATVGGERSRTGSIGVGLAVSRRLARLMDGDVVLDPSPSTCFVLELPLI